jgi:hypothetical protein
MRGNLVNATGIHVFGNFQTAAGYAGGDWMSGTTLLTKELADTNIYSILVNIPAFTLYEYKFLNGDQSYEVEFVPFENRVLYNFNDNRWFYLDSLSNDTTNWGAIRFSQYAPLGKHLIRYRVDMQNDLPINNTGVHLGIDFQNWNTTENWMYSFDSKVYEHLLFVDSTITTVNYKFSNGNMVSNYETVPISCANNDSRQISTTKDTLLPTVCFAKCEACVVNGINSVAVTKTVTAFPNPANQFIQFSISEPTAITAITLMDATGKKIRTSSFQKFSNTATVYKEQLPAGLYFVLIHDQTGNTHSSIFIFE